jgi:hypothetical protein
MLKTQLDKAMVCCPSELINMTLKESGSQITIKSPLDELRDECLLICTMWELRILASRRALAFF